MNKNTPLRNTLAHFLTVLLPTLCVAAILFSNQANSQSLNDKEIYRDQSGDPKFSANELALIKLMGPWPVDIPEDAGNEWSGLPWAETLGKELFNDPDLSATQTLACASCHQSTKGFADNLKVAVGASQHVRNTQGLLNVGLQRWFGWDGGTDSLWAASLRPILSDIEMDSTIKQVAKRFRNKNYVQRAFEQASNLSNPTAEAVAGARVTGAQNTEAHTKELQGLQKLPDELFVVLLSKAIAAYTRTLVSAATLFDRYRLALLTHNKPMQARYPVSAKRGLKTFLGNANCHVCHFGPNFSNGEFHDTGRPFFTAIGEVDSGRYNGIKRVRNDRYNLLGNFAKFRKPHNTTDHEDSDGVRTEVSDAVTNTAPDTITNAVSHEQRIRLTASVKLGQINFGQWRTPTLRNLKLTAPYMHDGSLATLRDVVDAYADLNPDRLHSQGESILKPLKLDNNARNDLVRFLETLSEPAED